MPHGILFFFIPMGWKRYTFHVFLSKSLLKGYAFFVPKLPYYQAATEERTGYIEVL